MQEKGETLLLLFILQRENNFVDLMKEKKENYKNFQALFCKQLEKLSEWCKREVRQKAEVEKKSFHYEEQTFCCLGVDGGSRGLEKN